MVGQVEDWPIQSRGDDLDRMDIVRVEMMNLALIRVWIIFCLYSGNILARGISNGVTCVIRRNGSL